MKKLLGFIVLVALTVFLTTQILKRDSASSASQSDAVYDRVMESGIIRCSYVAYDPANIVDPNTKAQSGILHDAAEEMAKVLNMKIEWVEEATWADFVESVKTGRADVFCGAAFGFAPELRYGEMVGPFYYSGITLWTRADDNRFDGNLEALNDPAITVVGEDGSIAEKIMPRLAPQAKLQGLAKNAPYSLKLDNVTTGKADATFVETYVGLDYLKTNPGSLKNATPERPVAVYPNVFIVAKGEFKLQSMLQGAVETLHNNGTIDHLLGKYEKHQGALLRVAKPYLLQP